MDGSDDAHGAGNLARGRVNPASDRRRKQIALAKSWLRTYRWSLIFVWVPTLLAGIYYFLIASDLYASETKFVVRSPSRMQAAVGLSSLLQGTAGLNRAQDDVYSVYDFVTSRDAIAALQKQLDLQAIFSRPGADFLARYPNPINHGSAEQFYRYYQKRVGVVYDSTTGISTITVKAFRPEDAKAIADALLKESEALVNELNRRAHDNAVRDAETDVKLAEQRVAQAQQDVLQYRNRETLLDPNKSSGALFEMLSRMQGELTADRTRINELRETSPDNPIRSSLEAKAAALQAQIADQRAKLAGGDSSMAPKISEYERLVLQQDFASRELASALASLESSREQARRQNIYIDRVVEPNSPDEAEFPKRIRTVLTLFVCCLMGYSMARLLVAGVREHTQS